MEKKLIIRIMTIADYEQVFTLWSAVAGMGMRSLDDSEPGIRKFLERNPRTCFVALDAGIVAGCILSGHDGRRGFIYHTAVQETHRKQGLGKMLVAAAEHALRSEGINKIGLVAFKTNEPGNRFWEKIGFSVRDDLVYRNKSINQENV